MAFIGADTGAEFTDDGSPTVFLSKPFQPATLLRTLHNLLDSAVTPRGLSA